jgi:hypothetical protein
MIYLQKDKYKDIPHHFDVACAMYGAMDLGLEYRLIRYEDIAANLITPSNLFVGSVEFMKAVFNRIGLNDVRLPENSNREYKVERLDVVKQMAKDGVKMFIKPFDIKLFTGFVIDKMQYTSISNIPDDTLVMVYKPFEYPIESEWRCYIHNNKVEYISNYSGDFYVSIDSSYLDNVINQNKGKFPVAYTIDIGVLSNGENVVIEYNDMWAIGNYGVPNDVYVRMLRDRYFEIIKN